MYIFKLFEHNTLRPMIEKILKNSSHNCSNYISFLNYFKFYKNEHDIYQM